MASAASSAYGDVRGDAAAPPHPVYLGQPEAAGYSDPPHLGSRRRPPASGWRWPGPRS